MIPFMILILLSVCNAQWPLQSIGHEEIHPIPIPPDQPGYPYDDKKPVHNVPNPIISHNTKEDPKRPNPFDLLRLSLPEFKNETVKVQLEGPETSKSSSSESNEVNEVPIDINKKPSLDTTFPVPASISKIVGNVSLSQITSVKDRVTNMVNGGRALRNDTDQLINQLNFLYFNLAFVESDNEKRSENAFKYGMSVILRFLFEFYRIFRRLSSQTTQTQLRLTNVDVYGLSYDKAIDVMKQKRSQSPLELSAPVRRSMDIFKGILHESMIVIQTKCSTLDPNWKCILIYLANLISESLKCSNVWYHAFIHMLSLEKIGLHDSFVFKIVDLDQFKELSYFDNLFDFIIDKLQEYREVGRVQLSAEAIFFTMLADLQENGLLDCVSVDYSYN